MEVALDPNRKHEPKPDDLQRRLAQKQAKLSPEEARQDSPITIIETGQARCVTEPRGANGLEGYGLGQSYRFERCEDGKGRYCRVYPGGSFPNYYETCGEVVFAGYFEPVEVQEAAEMKEGGSE